MSIYPFSYPILSFWSFVTNPTVRFPILSFAFKFSKYPKRSSTKHLVVFVVFISPNFHLHELAIKFFANSVDADNLAVFLWIYISCYHRFHRIWLWRILFSWS